MVNLIRIAAGGDVPTTTARYPAHPVLGFATLPDGHRVHALPRILGLGGVRPGPSVRLSFWLMVGGVVLRNAGQPLGLYPAGRILSLLSGGMELAAGLLFARFIFALLRQVRSGKYDRRDPLLRFVGAGILGFLATMAIDAAQAVWLAGHADPVLPAALNDSFISWLLRLLLAWIYGFAPRRRLFWRGRAPPGHPEATLAPRCSASSSLWHPGCRRFPMTWPSRCATRGSRSLPLSALVSWPGTASVARRFFRCSARPAPRPPRFRIAFGWLALWCVLELGAVVVSRTTHCRRRTSGGRTPAACVFTSDSSRC